MHRIIQSGVLSTGLLLTTVACTNAGRHDQIAKQSPTVPGIPKRQGGYLPEPTHFRTLGDQRLVGTSHGRRVVVDHGAIRVIDQAPIEALGVTYAVPEPLGGGFLFVSDTSVRFAPSFEAEPTLIASCLARALGGDTIVLGIGHSSIQLQRCGKDGPRVVTLPTGKPADPPVADLAELFATPSGMVGARTDQGRIYLAETAGAPWKLLAIESVERLELVRLYREDGSYAPWQLSIASGVREQVISEDGELEPVASAVPRDATSDALAPLAGPSPFQPLLEFDAQLMSPGQGVVRQGRDLVFFDAWGGSTTTRLTNALPGPECYFHRGGTPSLILCPGPNPAAPVASVFAIPRWGAALQQLESFPAYLSKLSEPAVGHALVFAGRCDGAARKGVFCVLVSDKQWKEFSLPAELLRQLLDVEPAVLAIASPDGDHVLAVARSSNQHWVVTDAGQGTLFRLAKDDIPEFVDRWDCATLTSTSLRVLVGGDSIRDVPTKWPEPGMVEIGFDGKATATRLQGQLRCRGGRALQLLPDGSLRETLDGGRSFHAVAPPPGGASRLERCTDTGCTIDSFFRVGWGQE